MTGSMGSGRATVQSRRNPHAGLAAVAVVEILYLPALGSRNTQTVIRRIGSRG